MDEPTYAISLVRPEDGEASLRLGREAFGGAAPDPSEPVPVPQSRPGTTTWGAYAGNELVAKLAAHEVTSWWGGTELPTMAVGGVTVAVEHRGAGLLGGLFRAALADHEQRGTAVSTLFPTAAGIYRRLGYELVSAYDLVEIPSSALAGLAPAPGVRLRRATLGDVALVEEVYARWAAGQDGPLARRGPAMTATAEEVLARHTGITLAEDEGGAVGYAAWTRSAGYGAQATLTVDDLVALTGGAYRALWRSIASHAAAVGTIALRTSGADVARTFVPTSTWRVTSSAPYMLRVVDVAVSLQGRASPVALDVAFAVAGDHVGSLDGSYRLSGDGGPDGALRCARTGPATDLPTYSPRGLALMVAGAQSSATIRAAGLLTGPTAYDGLVDAALGGRQLHVRDYF